MKFDDSGVREINLGNAKIYDMRSAGRLTGYQLPGIKRINLYSSVIIIQSHRKGYEIQKDGSWKRLRKEKLSETLEKIDHLINVDFIKKHYK